MKKVLLYQHQSSYNHGCEALVQTISGEIKRNIDSEIIVSSFFKSDDMQFFFADVDLFVQNNMWLRRFTFPWLVYQLDKRLLHNKRIQEAIMYCKECYEQSKVVDICVAIGGDNYCYNKGKEHWPLERKIKKLNKKMMLWGCSIEPEDIPGEMEDHLSNFDVITVRDPISYEALINSKVTSKIYRCADPAFLLEPQECPLPEGWEFGKMIGLNFSPMVMGNLASKDDTRAAVYRLVEYILEYTEDKIVLIPHVRLGFNDDVDELKLIYDKYKDSKRVLLIDDKSLNASQLKYMISNCKMFVGARTHATIAAYSTCVPTLAIGYSVKARGIARDLFGTEDGMTISVKELAGTDKLIDAYKNIYENAHKISSTLKELMPEYKEKALVSGEAFRELMKEI